MGKVLIDRLTTLGLIQDVAAHELPPEAWTIARNMRFQDGKARRTGGKVQVWTPSVAPYFHKFVVAPDGTPWWLYASLTKLYAFDFATHTDVTRTSGGDYNAANANAWHATTLGGIPIFTDGASVPQYWSAFSAAQAMQDLPNWPSTYRAKVIRAFGNNLIALGITKSGTLYPHLVLWSSPADPGAVPSSWDVSDPAEDAGENPLADVHAGAIQDGLQLGSLFYVYKKSSTWTLRRIGGRFVFDFDTFLTDTGILAPHCVTVCNQGQMHFMLTEDNMVVHDGSQVIPLLDKRMRRSVFNRLEQSALETSFVFHHPSRREVWACVPEAGNTTPNIALVWHYNEGGQTGVFTECEIDFVSAANGFLQEEDAAWDSEAAMEWAANDANWATNRLSAVVVARPTATKALQLDGAIDNDGVAITATLSRESIAVEGRDRFENWVVNWASRKLVTRVWVVASGDPFKIRIGRQLTPEAGITWTDYAAFDPSTQLYADLVTEGRAISIEFYSDEDVDWAISSYTLEQVVTAEH